MIHFVFISQLYSTAQFQYLTFNDVCKVENCARILFCSPFPSICAACPLSEIKNTIVLTPGPTHRKCKGKIFACMIF